MAKKGKKKSGGKKSKLDKMSEEERVLYMEHKLLQEEEERKSKEKLAMQYLKFKLTKEEKNTQFNLHKLNTQWREIMRQSKSIELKRDIEILSQTFERVVDRKKAVLESLGQDLSEAEEQYSMALRSHLQHVDRLIDLQNSRISTLQNEFDEESQILKREYDTERDKIMEQSQKELDDLQDIVFSLDKSFQEKEAEALSEFQSIRDEIKTKNQEEKHALRIGLEQVVDDYWRQFQAELNNYKETTEQRKKQFEELKAKDEANSRDIESQMKKIHRIQEQISGLRFRISGNCKEGELRKGKIREEKEVIKGQFMQLKEQMTHMRQGEREKLIKLTVESAACEKELDRKLEKMQRLMKLGEQARRFETEEEKVLPFYATTLSDEELRDVQEAQGESPQEELAKAMLDFQGLDPFWKRYNKVLFDRLALQKEQSLLLQENQQLRMVLKQYLDGISVNDEILSNVNPLFVVNQKTNVNLNVAAIDPRLSLQNKSAGKPVVIEASTAAKHLEPPAY
ncbi:dynein regulatory complex subunit 2-like [Symsagittifera roscoffensis]|uniref:dynein regulatory complex subunit 2-like n=1 Tax=Symsagittifera roscoffensis TaxID=84072 RepID=UPI00307B240A